MQNEPGESRFLVGPVAVVELLVFVGTRLTTCWLVTGQPEETPKLPQRLEGQTPTTVISSFLGGPQPGLGVALRLGQQLHILALANLSFGWSLGI